MPTVLTFSRRLSQSSVLAGIHLEIAAAAFRKECDAVDGEHAPAPQAALEALVASALGGEVRAGLDGVVAQVLHAGVGELDGLGAAVGDADLIERILKAHDAEPDRAVPQVGLAGLGDVVEVVVDDVVQHPHGGADRALQSLGVEPLVRHMGGQIDRAQVADGDLLVVGVQGDLGAEVGAMHSADVLVGVADVAGVLECDPGVAGLEQHGEHLAPQVHGLDALADLHLAALGAGLVGQVGLLEGLAHEVVQVRGLVGREQGPVLVLRDPLHEQVRHPVGGVHVMGAAAVVAGVLAQIQELLDVDVPGLQIGTDRALALAAVMDECGRGHVGLVAFDLEVVDAWDRGDRGHRFNAGEDPVAQAEPVVLGERGGADQPRDLGHGGDSQVEGPGGAGERDHGAVAAGSLMGVVALSVLTGAGDAEPQQLIAQSLGQWGGGAGEIDLLATGYPAVGL